MKKYSVSILMQRIRPSEVNNELRVLITPAKSKEEALGIIIGADEVVAFFKDGYTLALKVVVEI